MVRRRRGRAIPQDILGAIIEFVRADKGASEIYRMMSSDPNYKTRVPELRTLQRAVADIRGKLTQLDQPFVWHRIEEYDLPWEASAYLLEMWRMVMNGEMTRFNERGQSVPTVRQAKWWWRIHQAAPDLNSKGDVWFLAQRFVNREMLIQVLDEPLDFADLEAHLAYKPWENEDRIEAYRKAVQERRILELRRDDPVSIMLATSREDAFFAAAEAETSMFWLLPSQQRAQRETDKEVKNGDS